MSVHLRDGICALSQTKQYPEALKEWIFTGAHKVTLPSKCVCSHVIHTVNVIENRHNGTVAHVGSCCIRLFGQDSAAFKGAHTIPKALERIKQDPSKAANAALIDQAAHTVLTPWEVKFLKDTQKKRTTLTAKQEATRERLNKKVVNSFTATATAKTAQESLELLRKNPITSPNLALIDKAIEKKVIRPQDAIFLKQIARTAHVDLTPKQQNYKLVLNRKIAQIRL